GAAERHLHLPAECTRGRNGSDSREGRQDALDTLGKKRTKQQDPAGSHGPAGSFFAGGWVQEAPKRVVTSYAEPEPTFMNILGISAFYHDSAACLVQDGAIVAAAQEERFTRKKNDHRFPAEAI